jgi:hypothetical protein
MATSYRVWIEIEEIENEGTAQESFKLMEVPFGSMADFKTYEEAVAFARNVNENNG